MALAKIANRKVETFELFNADGYLLVFALTKMKRLDGDLFAHILGLGRMGRLNVVIVRDLSGVGQKDIGNRRRRHI